MVSLTTYNRSGCKGEEVEEEKISVLGSLKLSVKNSGAKLKNFSILLDQSEQKHQNCPESKQLEIPLKRIGGIDFELVAKAQRSQGDKSFPAKR